MLKVIVFDFDYTLGDSTNGIALSINYALGQLGHTAKSIDEIKKTIGLSLKETYYSLTAINDFQKAEQFTKLFKIKADEVMVENTILYEGVKETLSKLREQGYKVAIVTTKFHYRIEQILNKYNANNLIDVIVGAEDVKVEKPSPEGLLWVIDYFRVDKTGVLYVGDSIVDAKTAENAKVKFAAVLTGTTSRVEFESHSNVYIGKTVSDVCKNAITFV
ncbi:MAG: HAD family hydrolase [Lachnospiraceae bacterium]|nr:HAD family hydrolase [Lachnospiraceae bacterium]